MSNPALIPNSAIKTSSGDGTGLRPNDDNVWQSLPTDSAPSVELSLGYVDSPAILGEISIPSSTSDNIASFVIYIQGPDDSELLPYNPRNPSSSMPEVSERHLLITEQLLLAMGLNNQQIDFFLSHNVSCTVVTFNFCTSLLVVCQ